MKTKPIIIPKSTKRNPLVAPTKTRSGAGKHTNKKRKLSPLDQIEIDFKD